MADTLSASGAGTALAGADAAAPAVPVVGSAGANAAAPAEKIRMLQQLQKRLLKDLVQGNKDLTEQRVAAVAAEEHGLRPPAGDDCLTPPRVVIFGVCVPDALQQRITFSAETTRAIPIFFDSYKAARKFLGREQPWMTQGKFHALIYAPLQYDGLHMYGIFLELKELAMARNQALVLRIVATPAEREAYKRSERSNHDLLLSILDTTFAKALACDVGYFDKDVNSFNDQQLAADLVLLQTLCVPDDNRR